MEHTDGQTGHAQSNKGEKLEQTSRVDCDISVIFFHYYDSFNYKVKCLSTG